MKKLIVFMVLINLELSSQINSIPYKFTRISPFGVCEDKVKVVDSRPSSCNYSSILYPVFIENFDFKEDLPNNFGFNMQYTNDDDYGLDGNYNLWSGPDLEAYYNNLSVSNGTCYLTLKKETNFNKIPFANSSLKTYAFTFADLRTLFDVKGGQFSCKMKLPENNLLWPAYWLREGTAEIDIFEFYDGNVTQNNCDVYHSMRMTVHNKYGNTKCSKGRKFSVSPNFFNSPHNYTLVWTDYKYQILLDNDWVGYSTRYYDGPFNNDNSCLTGGGWPFVPSIHYSCNDMSNLTGCKVKIFNTCVVHNKVHKDLSFINANTPMTIFISCSIFNPKINDVYQLIQRDMLVNSWNNYSDVNKRIEIDQFVVWQPINCSSIQNVFTKSDFKYITGNTNFLSGSSIIIGGGSTPFDSYPTPGEITNKENFQFLAINEISFINEVVLNEGAYLRAEIIECNGVPIQQKITSESQSLDAENEEIKNINLFQIDSLKVDVEAISIFPNPTKDFLNIDMNEEDFYDVSSIEIIDFLGRSSFVNKSSKIDVQGLPPGFFQIKFTFTFGYIVVKSFVKE